MQIPVVHNISQLCIIKQRFGNKRFGIQLIIKIIFLLFKNMWLNYPLNYNLFNKSKKCIY